jgi:hypothetical protein
MSLVDWIKCIINPTTVFEIPKEDVHLFQIFASVLGDLLWFHRNRVVHDGVSPDALTLSRSVKTVSLEPQST